MIEATPAASSRPLAPRVFLDQRSLHERYYWWYKTLVEKIARLCINQERRAVRSRKLGDTVRPILDRWEAEYAGQLSLEWVKLLNHEQFEEIYQELYGLAKYVFAVNAHRSKGERDMSRGCCDNCAYSLSRTLMLL